MTNSNSSEKPKDQIDVLIDHLRFNEPSGLMTRKRLEELTGGLLKRQFLANIDCQGIGIEGRMMAGKTVIYPLSGIEKFLRKKFLRSI